MLKGKASLVIPHVFTMIVANFQNYVKSENFRHIFHDVLGDGIFNTDGESWRLQRRTSSQIFHVKNFQTAFTRYKKVIFINS